MKNGLWISLFLLTLTTGCGATVSRNVDTLVPGMTTGQVRQLWGEPEQSEVGAEKIVWQYEVKDLFSAGFRTPVTITFDAETDTMDQWQTKYGTVDRAKYARTAALMSVVLPVVQSAYAQPYQPSTVYTSKTTVKHHKDGRTTYKTKVRRKY